MLRNSIACLLLTTLAGTGYSTTLVEGNTRVLLGRYTTAEAEPTKALYEPLQLVAQITFPREHVTTIGDAINHTLLRTGYALVQPQSLPAQASSFLNLPLPEAQRTLGPYSVQTSWMCWWGQLGNGITTTCGAWSGSPWLMHMHLAVCSPSSRPPLQRLQQTRSKSHG